MSNIRNNSTINYYNLHAKEYFETTVNTDVSECCERFLKYLTPGDSIIDIGAGSGRDIHFFQSRGYIVDGISLWLQSWIISFRIVETRNSSGIVGTGSLYVSIIIM